MQFSPKSEKLPPQRIGVLLFDAFSNHCLANTVEPLRAANMLSGRALYDWQFLTVDGTGATSSSGLPVRPHAPLAKARGDLLMVLPSYGLQGHLTPAGLRSLRSAAARFNGLAGLDTGSWMLAEAGLLDGYHATIHWDLLDAFSETFPQVRVCSDRFVIDRDRASCGGAMTAFDLVQEMIGQRHGTALTLEISALFMQADRPPRDFRSQGAGLTERALTLMRRNLEDPLTIPDLARALGVSQRRLEARFHHRWQTGPRKIYQRLRLQAARRMMIQTDLGIAEAALRSGYADASAMTRAYRAEFGETPTATRAARQLGRTTPARGAKSSSPK